MTHGAGDAADGRFRLPSGALLLAHRAGNDLEHLRRAEAAGADVVEADVHLHGDVLELRHTKRLGPLPYEWDRWYVQRSRRPAPGLADLFSATAPGTRVMLDLKGVDRRLPTRLARALEGIGDARSVLVCSRHWRLLDALAGEPGLMRIYSAGSARQLAALGRRVERAGGDGVAIHARLLTAQWSRSLAGVVPSIMAWAVETAGGVRELAAAGANGFILDDMSLLRAAAATRPGPA